MKNIVITLSLLLILASCGMKKHEEKKSSFELKGKLENANGEQLYLEEMTDKGVNVIDTATLDQNGNFAFVHANPVMGFYRVRITDANFAMLVMDSTQKVTVTGDVRNLGTSFHVEGSPDSKLFWDLNQVAQHSYQKRDSMMRSFEAFANLNKENKKKIDEFSAKAEEAYNTEAKKLNNYMLDLINKNPASLVAIVALQQLTPEMSENGYVDSYKLVDEALQKKYPGSSQVKLFHATVSAMLKTLVGSPAPEFNFADPDGKNIPISSYKGKYVLLDFWASWCGPCRAESPNMVRIYKKYHAKGLEILGVSLDSDKAKWKAAIEKDKLEWKQVSDLAGWQSLAAKLYDVTSIPQTFLLDKDGKIIAKGLRAEGLEAKLEEVFK